MGVPGGKHEDNESATEAIVRELKEELSIEIETIEQLRAYEYVVKGGAELYFYPIVVKQVEGEMQLQEYSAVAWVSPPSLTQYELAPPDYEAIVILEQYLGRQIETQVDHPFP